MRVAHLSGWVGSQDALPYNIPYTPRSGKALKGNPGGVADVAAREWPGTAVIIVISIIGVRPPETQKQDTSRLAAGPPVTVPLGSTRGARRRFESA